MGPIDYWSAYEAKFRASTGGDRAKRPYRSPKFGGCVRRS